MAAFVLVGLAAEGTTDIRFLSELIKRVFYEVAFYCECQIELDFKEIPMKNQDFTDWVLSCSETGKGTYGIHVLTIHTDADHQTDQEVREFKINPALKALAQKDEASYCKIVSLAIPVRMIEAWMLADTSFLKYEVGTGMSEDQLGWAANPESYSNPKLVIEDGIRTAWQHRSRRHRNQISISELYQSVGAGMDLNKLRKLSSFRKFEESVKQSFRDLKLLHDQ